MYRVSGSERSSGLTACRARFPPLVIQLGAFLLSAAWGLGLYAMTYFALKHSRAGHQVTPAPDHHTRLA